MRRTEIHNNHTPTPHWTQRIMHRLGDLSEEASRSHFNPWVSSLQRQAATLSPRAGRSVERALQWAGIDTPHQAEPLDDIDTHSASPWIGPLAKQMRGLQDRSAADEPPLSLQACLHYVQAQQIERTVRRYPSLRDHVEPEVFSRAPSRSPLWPLQQRWQRLHEERLSLQQQLEQHMGLRAAPAGTLEFPEDWR